MGRLVCSSPCASLPLNRRAPLPTAPVRDWQGRAARGPLLRPVTGSPVSPCVPCCLDVVCSPEMGLFEQKEVYFLGHLLRQE